jgi:hypothetical protein
VSDKQAAVGLVHVLEIQSCLLHGPLRLYPQADLMHPVCVRLGILDCELILVDPDLALPVTATLLKLSSMTQSLLS